ncbi:MAG: ATP-grasp domain-containing protein [Bacteroidetes bacterium]|nr:ATP-grasp domain-containing protein [Bacteroidota bacterium]MBL6943415.1 ATP-grasp domain-containing protein [Bacteroidales bacterium]
MKKVVILINALSPTPTEDELDVLDEAVVVERALEELGWETERLFMDLNMAETSEQLLLKKPTFVFNLVESLDKDGKLIYFAPSILEHLQIPFTGCRSESMYITSNKTLTKKMLFAAGLPTPQQICDITTEKFNPSLHYIAKPVWEDASVGISDENILSGDLQKIQKFLDNHIALKYFFEEFISGREFNISVLAGSNGPEVLPIPEIVFENFPKGKPKIIGYNAKWDESSFEYNNTNRVFGLEKSDPELAQKLKQICLDCWHLFGLNGYARVDFRVDENGNPMILEINANPCLSADAGFYAATQEAGYSFSEVINRIIEDSWK